MLSTKSLEFFRIIYNLLKKDELVLLRVFYSCAAGDNRHFLIETFHDLRYFLKDLPEKSLIRISSIPMVNKRDAIRVALSPDENGNLTRGVY